MQISLDFHKQARRLFEHLIFTLFCKLNLKIVDSLFFQIQVEISFYCILFQEIYPI